MKSTSLSLIASIALVAAVLHPTRAAADNWASFRGDTQLTGVARSVLPATPELLWALDTGEIGSAAGKGSGSGLAGIESTAAIWEGTVFVGNLDGYLYAVDLITGKLRWRYEAGEEVKSSPAVEAGVVYFGDELGEFHAVDASTGKRRWTFRAEGGITSSANLLGDRVLFGS